MLIANDVSREKTSFFADEIFLPEKAKKLRFTIATKLMLHPVISLKAYQPSNVFMLSGGVTPVKSVAGMACQMYPKPSASMHKQKIRKMAFTIFTLVNLMVVFQKDKFNVGLAVR